MSGPGAEVLEALLGASAEPLLVADLNRPDWPVVFSNPAFRDLAGETPVPGRPLADVVEQLLGRELAVEVSETVRASRPTSIPLQWRKRELLLVVQPIATGNEASPGFCALFWRPGAPASGSPAGAELHQALMRARRRIRDLSRDDPVTGLLNETAFREVLAHDWAVAFREGAGLALVSFAFDEYAAYLAVFGRHATDSCLRRVAQAVKRHLRRASDVAARVSRDDGEHLLVLSHASDKAGVDEFATRIANAVRELGLHHPHSRTARFVTVSWRTILLQADGAVAESGERYLDRLLAAK